MAGIQFTQYEVGQKKPELAVQDNLVRMEYRDGVWEFSIGYPGIRPDEIAELKNGGLDIGFTLISGYLFFALRVGSSPWQDMPFEPRLLPDPGAPYPEFEDGKGAMLLMLIWDTATGELKHMRGIGLGTSFCNKLHAACRELDKYRPMDRATHNRHINAIYTEFPSSEDIARTVPQGNWFRQSNRS